MFDARIMGSIIAHCIFNEYSQFLYNPFGLCSQIYVAFPTPALYLVDIIGFSL